MPCLMRMPITRVRVAVRIKGNTHKRRGAAEIPRRGGGPGDHQPATAAADQHAHCAAAYTRIANSRSWRWCVAAVIILACLVVVSSGDRSARTATDNRCDNNVYVYQGATAKFPEPANLLTDSVVREHSCTSWSAMGGQLQMHCANGVM